MLSFTNNVSSTCALGNENIALTPGSTSTCIFWEWKEEEDEEEE